MVLLMDRLESNLRTEMRRWSQYDYEVLVRVLTPVQVIVLSACSRAHVRELQHRPAQDG